LNGYERACTALFLEEPDRVPFFEMHISPNVGKHILGFTPLTYNTPLQLDLAAEGKLRDEEAEDRIVEETANYIAKLELDFIRTPGVNSESVNVKKLDENRWLINGTVHAWSGETLWNEELRSREVDLRDVVDRLESLRDLRPYGERSFRVLKRLVKRFRGEVFVTCDADGSWGPIVSDPPLLLEVLKSMYTNPQLVERLLTAMSDRAIEVGKAALDEGADGILMCVDYGYSGGPWMPPELFRRFVKPALRKQCDAFRSAGGFALLHSDGNVEALLGDLAEAGIDAYQGIDVEAGMDLSKVKNRIGDKICLIGNVSPTILDYGSIAQVRKEVHRCLDAGAPGGGYVLSASANISVCTNAAGFLEMARLVVKKGKYPYAAQQ